MTSKSFDKRFEEIERKLLHIGKWGILASRIVGYFPYTVSNDKLIWRPFSAATFSTVTLSIGAMFWIYMYSIVVSQIRKKLQFVGTTEHFAQTLISYSFTFISVILTIRILSNGKKFLEFWQSNVSMLTNFSMIQCLDIFTEDADLKKLRRRMAKTLCAIIVLFLSHNLLGSKFGVTANNVGFMFVFLYWTYRIYFNVGLSCWSNYFPQLYGICFRKIRHKLNQIAKEFNSQSDFGSAKNNCGRRHLSECVLPVEIDIPDMSKMLNLSVPLSENPKALIKILTQSEVNTSSDLNEMVNICIDSYYNVCEQIKKYSTVFGMHLAINTWLEIMTILIFSYFSFLWIREQSYVKLVVSTYPIILFSIDLYFTASVAESMKFEAQETQNVLRLLPFKRLSVSTTKKVHALAHKLTLRPPSIDPGNYFTFNRSMLTSILSALVMNLIVLVQFENSEA
ncbi:unnamed protein product [Allacma fusca]|uniref:Gustatory receptor n=1 Tax=Allacma fusca TaxID=39272 RepID=A0A8J2LDR2_9HEXA|nr:unnamed protein product [Allacma fusca]